MKEIEQDVNALFKYPNLYAPQVVISGLREVSIPIITMNEPNAVNLAIWGLLPSTFNDDWGLFQKLTNTLTISAQKIDTNMWYYDSFKNSRCIIPVTGFFTSVLKNGEIYPYHVSRKNGGILYLAGIYTILDDGFITCSLLTGPLEKEVVNYQNLVDYMPVIIDHDDKYEWLSEDTKIERAQMILQPPHTTDLEIRPIAKNLFNQDISYDSMLMPYEYPES
ncbi:SOS response-associated peptidase family protein [Maribacter sp. BPC-D8]|uniref:SOS response-associated peptidase family protein n=1 Tax=Maribacter sp. BPC-D8 TaxID=3053613 RepID=UPI002B4AA5F6|nr:SOS response-associated peptidase family protein [Maribacter sp. BPC-D8]WRI28842.1 SOS response-associated peptidase family protein [Maribacter sp. BPC-D8]